MDRHRERYKKKTKNILNFCLIAAQLDRPVAMFGYVCVCVCVHACVYVYLHLCMYVCMHVCMYACMYGWMNECMLVCMHVWMYVCMHVCIDEWMYAYLYVCMHVYEWLCKYMSIYEHISPYTQSQFQSTPKSEPRMSDRAAFNLPSLAKFSRHFHSRLWTLPRTSYQPHKFLWRLKNSLSRYPPIYVWNPSEPFLHFKSEGSHHRTT